MNERAGPLLEMSDARPRPAVEHRIVEGAMARAVGPRRRPWVPMILAAGAAAAVAWWVTSTQPPQPEAPAAPAVAMPESAPPQPMVQFAMQLDEGAVSRTVEQTEDSTVIRLDRGLARFKVEPLPPGGVFAVQTPHARVEVVGTEFTVDVQGACSEVAVREGVVRVHRGSTAVLVSAGDARTVCAGAPAGEAAFRAALADMRARRFESAQTRLQAYLSAHPRGAFAEQAMFHLTLAQSRLSPAQAGAAVDRFLARYPHSDWAPQVRALVQR